MRITFLGTRGYIEAKSRRHRRHTAAMVERSGARIMIDCGQDWADRVHDLAPDVIILTHAHPDHAAGLERGAPGPVYATDGTWSGLDDYPIQDRRPIEPRSAVEIRGVSFEAFPVEHSIRCPAVGYRIEADGAACFYVPDVVYIHDREDALKNASLYVGDGATLEQSLVRKQGDRLIGHTPVRTQLTWCEKEGVPRAIITHCGSDVVEGDERSIGPMIRRWGLERGVEASIAHDGLTIHLG